MSTFKLVISANMAAVEYPATDNTPDFNLNEDGMLFIFGYTLQFMGKSIRCAKNVKTNLQGYKVLGMYNEAKRAVKSDFSNLYAGLDLARTVFFIQNS